MHGEELLDPSSSHDLSAVIALSREAASPMIVLALSIFCFSLAEVFNSLY
jgi:hypothetical protein